MRIRNNRSIVLYATAGALILLFTFSVIRSNYSQTTIHSDIVATSASNGLSNKKIGWGIKRADNHQQPDVGKVNKSLLDKYEGICLGNKDKKNIYLTFDEGYEAGYTEKILDTLKENNVKATFFITAHYLNTNENIVKRMVSEGHIIGNHISGTCMYIVL